MITNFETHTKPLTDYELTVLVPIIIQGLLHHKGSAKAITSSKICKSLTEKGYKVNDVTLRRCIKHIQKNHLLNWVVATGNGFFYTDDIRVVMDQIHSLRNREEAIRAVRLALENSLQKVS